MGRALRTVDLARVVGLSVQQVRNYEAFGFLPPAPRSASGYRLYDERHRLALQTARTLMPGYGWQRTLGVMRATHAGDVDAALALADARHAQLDRERQEVEQALRALRVVTAQSSPGSPAGAASHAGRGGRTGASGPGPGGRPDRGPGPLRIGEAARLVGVRVSAVRFWEQQGLLQPERHPESRYRLYDDQQVRSLQVVALLRRVSYRFGEIRPVLDELAAGRPERALRAVERRRRAVAEASRACARATAVLWRYAGEGE